MMLIAKSKLVRLTAFPASGGEARFIYIYAECQCAISYLIIYYVTTRSVRPPNTHYHRNLVPDGGVSLALFMTARVHPNTGLGGNA
jgi:hypothetical protein